MCASRITECIMSAPKVDIDWSKLLGFDQVEPGTDVLKNAAKIGNKPCPTYRDFSAPIRERDRTT